RITKIVTFLRAETPTEEIAKNPVVKHPHNTSRIIPERLPPATIKELSVLDPAKAIGATAEEWVVIAAAIAICSFFWHPALYVAAVVVIGSRQHALLILGHDASHYRYLPTRWPNELFANLFLMWPTFASVEGFCKFPSTHHQYTNRILRAFLDGRRLIVEQIGDEAARALLDQIERMVETCASAKERIGHVLGPRVRRVVEEAADLAVGRFGRELDKIVVVRAVHGDQQIELREVCLGHLPRALIGNVDAARACRGLCARVWRLTDVPIAKPGRVDLEAIEHALLFGNATEHALGHWRAADIAKADKEEA